MHTATIDCVDHVQSADPQAVQQPHNILVFLQVFLAQYCCCTYIYSSFCAFALCYVYAVNQPTIYWRRYTF